MPPASSASPLESVARPTAALPAATRVAPARPCQFATSKRPAKTSSHSAKPPPFRCASCICIRDTHALSVSRTRHRAESSPLLPDHHCHYRDQFPPSTGNASCRQPHPVLCAISSQPIASHHCVCGLAAPHTHGRTACSSCAIPGPSSLAVIPRCERPTGTHPPRSCQLGSLPAAAAAPRLHAACLHERASQLTSIAQRPSRLCLWPFPSRAMLLW